jgi:hypothetical protein
MSCGDVGGGVVSPGAVFVSGGVLMPPAGGRVTSEQPVTANASPNVSAQREGVDALGPPPPSTS